MKRDLYQYRQGRQYALEIIAGARSTLCEPSLLGELISNLKASCINKPPSMADGIRSIVELMGEPA